MAEDAVKAYIESQLKHGKTITGDSKTIEGVLNLEYA